MLLYMQRGSWNVNQVHVFYPKGSLIRFFLGGWGVETGLHNWAKLSFVRLEGVRLLQQHISYMMLYRN